MPSGAPARSHLISLLVSAGGLVGAEGCDEGLLGHIHPTDGIKAQVLLMGKNGVDAVYDSDPKTNFSQLTKPFYLIQLESPIRQAQTCS